MNPNVILARRWFEEVWNERRTETIDELLTAESTCYSETGVLKGPEDFITNIYTPLIQAMPDLKVAIEGFVAEGDNVVTRWVATGNHSSHSMGMPATGRRISFRGMTWMRFADGRLMEGWDCFNQTGLMQALQGGNACQSVSCT